MGSQKPFGERSRQEIANDIEMLLAADTIEVQNEQEVFMTSSFAPQRNRSVPLKMP